MQHPAAPYQKSYRNSLDLMNLDLSQFYAQQLNSSKGQDEEWVHTFNHIDTTQDFIPQYDYAPQNIYLVHLELIVSFDLSFLLNVICNLRTNMCELYDNNIVIHRIPVLLNQQQLLKYQLPKRRRVLMCQKSQINMKS